MTELGRLCVCICICISREGMSSDRAREATCAMFVNTPTGPTTATVQQAIWVFQCRAFSRPQTLYSLLLSPSFKSKKRKHESSPKGCPYFSLGWREGLWSMKDSPYCCTIFKICKYNALSWESSVFAKAHGEKQSGPTLIDRVHIVCCNGGKCIFFTNNFIYHWVTTVSVCFEVLNYVSSSGCLYDQKEAFDNGCAECSDIINRLIANEVLCHESFHPRKRLVG